MKNIFIFATLLSFYIVGCTIAPKDNNTQVSMSCIECAGMDVSITTFSIIQGSPKEVRRSKFDSLGRAIITFTHNDTLNVFLQVGDIDRDSSEFHTTLYLEPATRNDLKIENGQVSFEGDLKIFSTYYNQVNLIERERAKYAHENYGKFRTASSAGRKIYRDSLMQFGRDLVSKIKQDRSISDYHRAVLLDQDMLFMEGWGVHLDAQAAIIEKNDNDWSIDHLSPTLSNVFDGLVVHENFINNSLYIFYLRERLLPVFRDILNYRYEKNIKTEEYEYVKTLITKNEKLSHLQELLMALFIAHLSTGSEMDYNISSKLIREFKTDFPQSKYLEELNAIVSDFYDLRSGAPLKDIEMRDVNEKTVKLSHLKGNLVYIDVWATWCGPCLEELEYSKKLSKRYATRPGLKFLYVSVDQDTEKWKKFLQRNKQIKGVHGIQNISFLADSNIVTSLYNIYGIPRYILIDKNGNIITTNAKRPSELVDNNDLDSLLTL